MIRKLLCLLGFHKFEKRYAQYCYAPDDFYTSDKCLGTDCSKCKYFHEYSCIYCGRAK
jgi:hypothetical protein